MGLRRGHKDRKEVRRLLCAAGLEDGARGHKPGSAASSQKLKKAKTDSPPKREGWNAALPHLDFSPLKLISHFRPLEL